MEENTVNDKIIWKNTLDHFIERIGYALGDFWFVLNSKIEQLFVWHKEKPTISFAKYNIYSDSVSLCLQLKRKHVPLSTWK